MAGDIPARLSRLHDECDDLLDRGQFDEALGVARRAYRLASEHPVEIGQDLLVDTLYLYAQLLVEADASHEALPIYDEVARLAPDDPDLPLWRGIALVHLARFDEAEEQLRQHRAEGEAVGDALWHLAILAEFRGDHAEADALFRRAHAADPERFPSPVRMGADAVQRLLSQVIESLPDTVRAALGEVVIQVEPLPDRALLCETDPPTSPFVLGLHIGVPWGDQSVFDTPQHLNRILIFQRNIERIAADRETLHEELRTTLLHEIGHHLGWDEDDLRARGLD